MIFSLELSKKMEYDKHVKSRKIEHLLITLSKDVESGRSTLLECVELLHNPLTDADFDIEDESFSKASFLGYEISMPFMIGAMTGGHPDTKIVNDLLSKAAEELRIPIATGSAKAALRALGGDPSVADTYSIVAENAPSVPRIVNLGIEDLIIANERGKLIDALEEAIDLIDASAIQIHINPLQEIAQKGRVRQRGIIETLTRIKERSDDSKKTVIIKEVGSGFSPHSLSILSSIGFERIDVEGVGGTSWAKVEELRGGFAGSYASRGVPTAVAIIYAKRSGFNVIAGGGIRTGLDALKAIALGASLSASALGVLRALFPRGSLDPDYENLIRYLKRIAYEIRIGIFLSGARNLKEFKSYVSYIIKPPLSYYLQKLRGFNHSFYLYYGSPV